MLTNIFIKLVNKYANDRDLANNLWLELFTKYADSSRHYHNMEHLEFMYNNLKEIKRGVEEPETLAFAVFFHDIIYKASSNTNEEDSAKWASQTLSKINYPSEKIKHCNQMILATKLHKISSNNDTNLLIDADLAILGVSPEEYQKYSEKIREEYKLYPDFLYNTGRKKILINFLESEGIYKTEYFKSKFEKQAIININNELDFLNS